MDDRAEIMCLWIAENHPDRFSGLIQWLFGTPYSHCVLLIPRTGMLWHATTPGGVLEESPAIAMKGCHTAASIRLTLNCSHEELISFLEGEKHKPYGHRGNIGLLIDRLPWPANLVVRFFTKHVRPHVHAERNCSEFLGIVIDRFYKKLPGNPDKWTPTCIEKWLQPKRHI